MAQGEPFSMVNYGIWVVLLIKYLNAEHPSVTCPWYTGDAGAACMYSNIELYFNFIKKSGLGCGYYPDPCKRVMILHLDNIGAGKLFVLRSGFKVCTGAHYVGVFMGYDESKFDWLQGHMLNWEKKFTRSAKIRINTPMKLTSQWSV